MKNLCRTNLQQFCRTCLNSLVERTYNLIPNPHLRKLLLIFTSMDAVTDKYPQRLCQMCYDKLQEFQEFRQMILNSAQRIECILKQPGLRGNSFGKTSKSQNNSDCLSDDENQLLLPELAAQWNPNIVKKEPVEVSQGKFSNIQIKNEIENEHEQDDSNFQFYEQIALRNLNTTFSETTDKQFDEHLTNIQILEKCQSKKTPRKRDRNKHALKCPQCDKKVYKEVYLDAHIRAIHEGHDKPFLCSLCQKSFTRYSQLVEHTQTNHTNSSKFICGTNGCAATFTKEQTLQTHRQVVHIEETALPLDLEQIIDIQTEQIEREWINDEFCTHCGKKYSSKRALSVHLKRHLQIKDHVCKTCGVAKVTRTELLSHMRTHDSNLEKFKCNICPQEFTHKNAISRHIRTVHEGERRFLCTYCLRRFGTRHAKISHERLHTGERPFKCDICQKGYARIEGLRNHMKNHVYIHQ